MRQTAVEKDGEASALTAVGDGVTEEGGGEAPPDAGLALRRSENSGVGRAGQKSVAKTEQMCYDSGNLRQQRISLPMAEMTRQDVIRIVATGQRRIRLRGVDLSGLDLSYLDLSVANLSYANLSNVNLAHACLSETVLFGANLAAAVLSDANLRYAELIGADLSDADLSHANLDHANLHGALLAATNLAEARCDGALFDGARPDAATIWPDGLDLGAFLLDVDDE